MNADCDFKYTCTPWYVYIIIMILIFCSTLAVTVYSSYSSGVISSTFGAATSISCSICNTISFLLCIGLLSLLCPTKPGRIVLWIIVICSISMLLSNILTLVGVLTGISSVETLVNKYSNTSESESSTMN